MQTTEALTQTKAEELAVAAVQKRESLASDEEIRSVVITERCFRINVWVTRDGECGDSYIDRSYFVTVHSPDDIEIV